MKTLPLLTAVALTAVVAFAADAKKKKPRCPPRPGGEASHACRSRREGPGHRRAHPGADRVLREPHPPAPRQPVSQVPQRCRGQDQGGLALDTREGVLKGGDSGPAVIPGNPDKSPLILANEFTFVNWPRAGDWQSPFLSQPERRRCDGSAPLQRRDAEDAELR